MRFKALTNGRIAKSDEAEPEWMLVSGDEIDVYFALRDAIHLVEAKSAHFERNMRCGVCQLVCCDLAHRLLATLW